jgi:hypothetical protein
MSGYFASVHVVKASAVDVVSWPARLLIKPYDQNGIAGAATTELQEWPLTRM